MNSEKNYFSFKKSEIFEKQEKKLQKNAFFLVLGRIVFDKCSPVHPVSESRGGPLSVTEHTCTEILVSYIGYTKKHTVGNALQMIILAQVQAFLFN